jgi:hypothetical protein
MATENVPFDQPEEITDVEDIVDPNETVSDGNLILPSGRKGEAPQYTTLDRKLTIKKKAVSKGQYEGKPFLSIAIEMEEVEDQDGQKVKPRFPLRAFVNTLRWPNGPGKVGVRPSSADKYLEACGISVTGLSGQEIYDALMESATSPAIVHLGWEEAVTKGEDGTYPDPRFKTGDFRRGENGEFVESFADENGEEVRARNVVTYFSAV